MTLAGGSPSLLNVRSGLEGARSGDVPARVAMKVEGIRRLSQASAVRRPSALSLCGCMGGRMTEPTRECQRKIADMGIAGAVGDLLYRQVARRQ